MAAIGVRPAIAVAAVLGVLVWWWGVVLRGLWRRSTDSDLVLETIPASHFVEKVRWAMDRLGLEYREHMDVGTLGVFFTGRTVPRLRVRTGAVTSTIGNSSDILRYLWRCHAAGIVAGPTFWRSPPPPHPPSGWPDVRHAGSGLKVHSCRLSGRIGGPPHAARR